MNSKDTSLTTVRRAAIAKHIILSKGGSLILHKDDLVFPVRGRNGSVTKKAAMGIAYVPGWGKGWQVWFSGGGGYLVTDSKDLRKIYDYILDHYKWPDEYADLKALRKGIALRELNFRFISAHGDINPHYIAQVNHISGNMLKERTLSDGGTPVPMPGDVVEGAYYGGHFHFRNGTVQSCNREPGKVSVCAHTQSSIASLFMNRDGELKTSVYSSGGPFFSFLPGDLEFVGTDETVVNMWGHIGYAPAGLISFPVKVNRWKIRQGVKY